MNLYRFADKIVFKILQDIDSGYLEITSFDGEIMKFGNPEDTLKAHIRIKKPNKPVKALIKVRLRSFNCLE